jgi:hypothetical protein
MAPTAGLTVPQGTFPEELVKTGFLGIGRRTIISPIGEIVAILVCAGMVWFSRDLIGAREITFAADRPKEARLTEQITGTPVSPLYSVDHDRH